MISDEFDPSEFPASYKDNLPKENLVLQYAENFRRQYVHLYRDRKPLFLNPINECGVDVSTLMKKSILVHVNFIVLCIKIIPKINLVHISVYAQH